MRAWQGAGDEAASLEVTGETSLEAGRRLQAELGAASAQAICVLNFASAKNPGGGFQNGASAQEESLARSSGLLLGRCDGGPGPPARRSSVSAV